MTRAMCLVIILTILAAPAWAQRGDRRGFDPGEILRRADDNQNGRLEPEEISGRLRSYLERVASDADIDLSRGVSVEKMEKAIRNRIDRDRDENDRGDKPSSKSPSKADEPAVAGFGEEQPEQTVPGFGTKEDLAKSSNAIDSRYPKEAVETVNKVLLRYDRDNSGALERSEWDRVRWDKDNPPSSSDTNKDNILSREELLNRATARSRSASRSSRSSSSSSRSSESSSPDNRILRYADSLLYRYDRNKNGKLEQDEWKNMRGDWDDADRNGDRVLTKDEIAARLSRYSRGRSSRSSSDSGSSSSRSSRDSNSDEKNSYRFLSPIERLPKGLPSWFAASDKDQDGQVMMHEFSSYWTDSKAAEFLQYDLNNDGVLTPEEYLSAKDR